MSETATFEPQASWLVELQRDRCGGGSALSTFQGLLVDEIVLPQSAADDTDPSTLVRASDAFTDALMKQVHLIPGEFSLESMMGFYVRDYITCASAQGHAQYFSSRGGDDLALRCTAAGLKSMIADPHLEIFNLYVRLRRTRGSTQRKTASQAGYGSVQAALRDADKRLAELETKEPLTLRHRAWLKSLRKLKLVPDAEMTPTLVRYAQANPLFDQRRAEAGRQRAEFEAKSPAHQAAKRLCEMAGMSVHGIKIVGPAHMRDIWSEGPDKRAYQWRIETDRGPRNALFYVEGSFFKRYLAVLLEDGAALPLGSLTLSKGEYEAILNHRD